MSMWNTSNDDAKSVSQDQITSGRRLSFLEGLEASYDESVRYSSAFGAERALQEEEGENVKRIRAAGGNAPETLSYDPIGPYGPTAPYSDFIYNEPGKRSDVNTKERNDQLKKLQEQFPDAGIKTYDDMFATVKEKSDAARRRAARGTTIGGSVGGFIGGAAGGINPLVNPLNAASLVVGGAGKTAVGRIAVQAGAGGVAEALNQATGVQANQRVLGGDPTLGDAAIAVAGAAVAGGVLQGVGEGLGAAGRRWFSTAANDVPPPPPIARPAPTSAVPDGVAVAAPRQSAPIPPETERLVRDSVAASLPGGATRTGRRTAAVDLDHMARQLDTWAPELRPWEIPPPTSTRLPGRSDVPVFQRVEAIPDTVDGLARAADPDTFVVYDKLAARAQSLRDEIGNVDGVRAETAVNAAAVTARDQINTLRERIATSKPKQRARLESEVSELEAQFSRDFGNADTAAPTSTDLAVAAKREQLQALDYKMRDMAPAVSRAYARARNEWVPPEELRAAVEGMVSRGERELAPADTFKLPERMPELRAETLADVVPEMRSPYAAPVAGEKAIKTVQRVAVKHEEIATTALDAFRASAGRALADAEAEGGKLVIEVNGRRIELDNDMQLDVALDGDDLSAGQRALTAKQLMQELDADNQIMKAVTSCQIR